MKRKSQKGVKLGRRTVNKSEEIRNAAKQLISTGKPPRPIDIVDALKAKGIKITSGQVSLALSGTELSLKHHVTNRPPAALMPDPAKALPLISLEELEETREFVRKLGSAEKALSALVVFRQLKPKETPRQTEEGNDKTQ
jgi:hypothetical protein